jgi:hypothetical protein
MLKMIEEAADADPVELQNGFNAYDDCSVKSKKFIFHYLNIDEYVILISLEYDDECVTASEIYSCGRDKEPGIVDVIFNTEKGNTTVVMQ